MNYSHDSSRRLTSKLQPNAALPNLSPLVETVNLWEIYNPTGAVVKLCCQASNKHVLTTKSDFSAFLGSCSCLQSPSDVSRIDFIWICALKYKISFDSFLARVCLNKEMNDLQFQGHTFFCVPDFLHFFLLEFIFMIICLPPCPPSFILSVNPQVHKLLILCLPPSPFPAALSPCSHTLLIRQRPRWWQSRQCGAPACSSLPKLSPRCAARSRAHCKDKISSPQIVLF